MAEMFSGDWTVEGLVERRDIIWEPVAQPIRGELFKLVLPLRFVIAGSIASDGEYPVSLTLPPVSVSGPRWSISLELGRHGRFPQWWVPLDIRRTSAAYTIQGGLVFSLGTNANDQYLICRNVDPQLNPWRPFLNPYDFILPKRREPKRPIRPPRQPD